MHRLNIILNPLPSWLRYKDEFLNEICIKKEPILVMSTYIKNPNYEYLTKCTEFNELDFSLVNFNEKTIRSTSHRYTEFLHNLKSIKHLHVLENKPFINLLYDHMINLIFGKEEIIINVVLDLAKNTESIEYYNQITTTGLPLPNNDIL